MIGVIGVVASFNVIYIVMTVLSAYATFLLVRTIRPTAGYEAWLAGVLFSWSPVLVTRGAGHFSLVAAASLPLFVLQLIRTDRHRRLRNAAALGLTFALAYWSDVYYPIYCLMLAAAYVTPRLLSVHRRSTPGWDRQTPLLVLDSVILCVSCVIVILLVWGGWVFTAFGHRVSIHELYTPVLVLSSLVMLRKMSQYRLELEYPVAAEFFGATRLAICASLTAALPLSPALYAVGVRIAQGRWVSPAVFWRSSPIGVDLLSIVLPNPNHPLAPEAWRSWLSGRPDGYLESVAALPLSAILVLALAWRSGWRPPRLWIVTSLGFAWLSLGPFLRIAGVNTYVPGPWALLRYAPVIGLARNPARFAVPMMLAVSILLALALNHLKDTWSAGRRWAHLLISATVMVELLPIPRGLCSARGSGFMIRSKADPRNVNVLELPFGVRDGTFSVGNIHSAHTVLPRRGTERQ